MIPIARPLIGEEEQAAVLEVLTSGQLAQGKRVRAFEEAFADWCGTKYAVAVSSGTAALHIALLAHGIGPGDEVITTPFSFIASANCARYVGADVRFADIEPAYYTLDPAQVAAQITPRTRAIIPVHLFGQACDMFALAELAEQHNLILVEDACQAHGATLGGRMVGSWGTACYSFYPTKNMTTGEGGMITTNDAMLAERARLLREHGMRVRYVHEMLGYNLRMTDIQAAIGLVQLTKLAGWNRQRQANAAYLSERLTGQATLQSPAIRPKAEHVFHQYTIRTAQRDWIVQELTKRGIGTGVYYPIPIHQQTIYAGESVNTSFTEVERASREVLSLPVHPSLTRKDLDSVVQVLHSLVGAPTLQPN